MNRLLLIITLIIATAGLSFGQTPQAETPPVKWDITVKMKNEFYGVVQITATPAEGWHLYGTDIPQGGPKPTTIDLSGSTGVRFRGELKPDPKPRTVSDPLFGIDLTWWEKPVTFSIGFKLEADKAKPRIKAKVTYMACDDNTCSPPATINLFKTVRPLPH